MLNLRRLASCMAIMAVMCSSAIAVAASCPVTVSSPSQAEVIVLIVMQNPPPLSFPVMFALDNIPSTTIPITRTATINNGNVIVTLYDYNFNQLTPSKVFPPNTLVTAKFNGTWSLL